MKKADVTQKIKNIKERKKALTQQTEEQKPSEKQENSAYFKAYNAAIKKSRKKLLLNAMINKNDAHTGGI